MLPESEGEISVEHLEKSDCASSRAALRLENTTNEFTTSFNDTNLSVFKNFKMPTIPDTNPQNYRISDRFTEINVQSEANIFFLVLIY